MSATIIPFPTPAPLSAASPMPPDLPSTVRFFTELFGWFDRAVPAIEWLDHLQDALDIYIMGGCTDKTVLNILPVVFWPGGKVTVERHVLRGYLPCLLLGVPTPQGAHLYLRYSYWLSAGNEEVNGNFTAYGRNGNAVLRHKAEEASGNATA